MGNRFDTPLHSQSQQQHPAQQPIQVAPPSGQHVISSTTAVSVQPSMGNPVQTSVQLGAPPAHHGQHVTAAAHGGMRLGPVAGASQQLSAAASVAQVPHMASIIRGQPPASALQSQHALQHAFTSHVPRGKKTLNFLSHVSRGKTDCNIFSHLLVVRPTYKISYKPYTSLTLSQQSI